MSEILFKWRGMLRMEASQDQILTANLHWEKRCRVDSVWFRQLLQMERMLQPFSIKFSSVGILSCMILQDTNDLEGGISTLQIDLAQCSFWPEAVLWRKASLRDKFPVLVHFQTSLSSRGTLGMMMLWINWYRWGKAWDWLLHLAWSEISSPDPLHHMVCKAYARLQWPIFFSQYCHSIWNSWSISQFLSKERQAKSTQPYYE